MGCAYGNVVLAALNAGAAQVIACDMEKEHLKILEQAVHYKDVDRLQTIQGSFPKHFDFKKNSIGAIHASHILEFLNGNQMTLGLKKFHHWLKPGGKLFILCYTIFIKELVNEAFIAEYSRRKNNKEPWPGYLENFDNYTSSQNSIEKTKNDPFPSALHVYEKSILVDALTQAGFSIELATYLDGKSNGAMQDTWFDGREYIGIIATKVASSHLQDSILK